MAKYVGYKIEIRPGSIITPIYEKIGNLFGKMRRGYSVYNHNLARVFFHMDKETSPYSVMNNRYPNINALMIVNCFFPDIIYLVLDKDNIPSKRLQTIESKLNNSLQKELFLKDISEMSLDSIDILLGIKN